MASNSLPNIPFPPPHPYPRHHMALPSGHFPPLYSEDAYPAGTPYGDMDQDMYASHILAWSLEPRKQPTVPVQPSQHIISPPPQQPQLAIQTQFHDMEHFKCGSYYSSPPSAHKISTPSSPSPQDIYPVCYPPRVPSDEWRAAPDSASYHSQSRPYVVSHQPSHVHVKREEPQYAFPLLDSYPQQSYHQVVHPYEQASTDAQGAFSQNVEAFRPYPASPPASESSITSQQGMNLACNPRYVSQTQEPTSIATSAEHVIGSVPQDQNGEAMEGHDDDAEGELDPEGDGQPLETPLEYSSSASSEPDDDDPDYDPRDPDLVYRPTRRRRCSAPTRQSHRYSPYSVSPAPMSAVEGNIGRRQLTMSNVSESSTASSSSYLPLTPTSPTESASTLKSRSTSSLPLPVPIPNLTKKSRGRRVPTINNLEFGKGPASTSCGLDNGEFGTEGNPTSALPTTAGITGGRRGASKGVRMFTCKVPGCGKCFARGEHLKRHVRSIHTYEKPHKCPHPGCGKDFSRHDNLNQHMRVHRRDGSSGPR